jgi:hypothetical protein
MDGQEALVEDKRNACRYNVEDLKGKAYNKFCH